MVSQEAKFIYTSFITQAVASRAVWALRCDGDLVVLTGDDSGFLPLWPDLESARFFSAKYWPALEPATIPLRILVRVHLRALARAGVLVGIGMAPYHEAVVLRANHLRRDLISAKRAA